MVPALTRPPQDFKNVSTWERWPEKGHEPALLVLDRLAQIYRCSVADLVSDLGDHGFDSTRRPAMLPRWTDGPS